MLAGDIRQDRIEEVIRILASTAFAAGGSSFGLSD